ncbi:MAG: formate dehydrogenase accessory sulfurtransferase FdhD [Chthoniobacter sp.]|nr:formate dehydrogenase accessory sulfurtransferase FdhD [Chthoniobacter sp.]
MLRYADARMLGERDDVVAVEEPLEIRVEGRSIAVVMRTPGHDRELAAGFLLAEGVIKSASDLFDITTCVAPAGAEKGHAVDVALARPGAVDLDKLTRHVFTSSSCGICSQTSIDAVLRVRKRLTDRMRIDAATLLALPERLAEQQTAFQTTGGLHACALFDRTGKLLALREDVGRHNALDKLAGWALLEKRTPLRGHVVLLSGRTSFEMMQKAHAAGIPVVASISAPSSLAVEFARASGQTLAGFVRGRSMNLYTGAQRIGKPAGRAGRAHAAGTRPTSIRKARSSRRRA